ncbi:MAG: helix-turn-helix domain-containing protein [Planctomycetes bacterium]|nr:helix-turn-helix domain-containing protein [Planctomycetota bacterium]
MADRQFLTVTQVMKLLGCRDRTPVYKAIAAQRLKAVRLGPLGTWRIPRESWEQFVSGDKR